MIVNKPTKKKKISRYKVLSIIMFIIFGAITMKLIYLQILNYDNYKERANANSTRFVSEKAPRGKIYDQNGNILATNIQTYTITYTKTPETEKNFYSTMSELFKILSENNESFQDTLSLKLNENNEIYFDYKTSSSESRKYEEIRFKRDRGLNQAVENKLFKGKEELNDKEIEQVNNELVKISLEDTFYYLVKSYNLIECVDPNPTKQQKELYSEMDGKELTDILLKNGYSLNDIRNFIVIKDAIKMQSFKGYKAVTIAGNIKKDTAFIVYQKLNDLPGIDVSLEPVRYYPNKELASSVLGYVSSIDSSKTEKYELRGYDVSSDLIGRSGIESSFEEQLKGVKGGTTVKVNSQGRVTEELFKLETHPGNDVHLTIDNNIQYAAEQSFADTLKDLRENQIYSDGTRFVNATRGALIAVEVNTGRILSLVSYPDYDPNIFTIPGTISEEERKNYFNPDYEAFAKEMIQKTGINKTVNNLFPLDENGNRKDNYDLYPKPFYNYATMGLIPPGSTFKPLTAVAGLESGVVSPTDIIVDRGIFTEHPETFGKGFAPKCLIYSNGGGTHGNVDVAKAIQVSCNYYFYEVAYRLYKYNGGNLDALNSIAKYAWQFGLGVDPNSNAKKTTGIEIEENFGQTYNFDSSKEQAILYAKFYLVNYLESGDYNGIDKFVKFDIQYSEDDNEVVKAAKQSIKDKVTDILKKVGTDEQNLNFDEFSKEIKPDVQKIINNSDVYKARVAEAENNGRKVNLEEQASIVSRVIAKYTINDKAVEIKSPAQLVSASIGQGLNLFTPMQLASYVSTLANGGTRYKLHLVDKVTDNDGNIVQEYKPEILNKVTMKDSTIAAIRDGMSRVNNEEGGTATATFKGFPIKTAGKTGTADFQEHQEEIGRKPYATYVSYAPADNPQIAVVAVGFDGGHGGAVAPAVKAVYEAYFKDQLMKEHPEYVNSSQSFKKYILGNPNNNAKQEISNSQQENINNSIND
ncbi:penicillin-binding transpeptidase domain-containing protein [Clostridium weizhouense]|uniref:Penicillin-binding protein n=1 Tax=Clostridium weizhouense TaxID=2859781 RepID=A0ABS7AJJ3_9CLOT|nr:penicillin-binding transpeptidase domain-containing protein [Clostridium weizhouense]MBW6408830.1 penicillin-binding protein [Clostridium weizhouense]